MHDLIKRLRDAASAAQVDSDSTVEAGLYIWLSGGWAMIALAVVGVFIFTLGFHVLLRLRRKGFRGMDERRWRRWISQPADRKGPIGALFDEVTRLTDDESVQITEAFDEIRTHEVEPFIRDLKLMHIAVGAAPLVGLLGTVTGMLATFDALSSGGGGEKTMSMIAKGISEALYTTETGLVVALPGLFFHYYLSRKFAKYKAFLARTESVWCQKGHDDHAEHLRTIVEDAVREEVAARFGQRVALEPSRA